MMTISGRVSGNREPVDSRRIALAWAVLGAAGGMAELVVFLAKCHYLDPRNYNVSHHFPWMFLVSGLVVSAPTCLLLMAAERVRPGTIGRGRVLGILAFLPLLGVAFRLPLYTLACLPLAMGLAARGGIWLEGRAARLETWAWRGLALLVGISILGTVVSHVHARGSVARGASPRDSSTNVLLVVLDTVRADRLSIHGHDRPTTPNLTRHAARGVVFAEARATAPWTAPSHASMFTGRMGDELSIDWKRPLDRSVPTLASHLSERGYETSGFVANTTYCSYETGLARGFGHYEDYDVTPRSVLLCSSVVQRVLDFARRHPRVAWALGEDRPSSTRRKSAERINADFLRWLDTRADDRPFFTFLNYYDAHHPYLTPEGHSIENLDPEPCSAEELATLRAWWGMDKSRLDASKLAHVRKAYDDCITYLDHQLGRLLDELGRRGLLERTLVVITADHGEHLGERSLFGHGVSLYRPELHVPLVVLDPRSSTRGAVVSQPVSLRDLPATVVERLGLPGSPPFPGRSLAGFWDPAVPAPEAEPVFARVASAPEDDPNHGRSPAARGPLTSVLAWGHHYIVGADGREELYDLAADVAESQNIVGSSRAQPTLDRLRSTLRR